MIWEALSVGGHAATSRLYIGDKLGVLREHIAHEWVGLVHLAQPFNSSRSCNVIFARAAGMAHAASVLMRPLLKAAVGMMWSLVRSVVRWVCGEAYAGDV